MTKLSIITINYNDAVGIRKTMESVFAQTCRDFEYIVVDGASTDDSIDVIRTYSIQAETLNFKWISEPDTGIYNAMNKGVKLATGEYILMLNSGDYLVDKYVIEKILPSLNEIDIIQGNIITIHDDSEIINRGYGKSEISFIDAMGGYFLHQASFTRKDLFEKYGYFDESYRINADTVFFAKCLAFGNATFRYVDLNVAYYDTNGVSASVDDKWVKLRKYEDLRYEKMFSQRMLLLKNEVQKIKLYDTLHSHKWIWFITMVLVHISNWLYKKK